MRTTGQNVLITIQVQIVHIHVGCFHGLFFTFCFEFKRSELPGLVGKGFRSFPPAVRDENIGPSILIQVAHAQAMVVFECSVFHRVASATDRLKLPHFSCFFFRRDRYESKFRFRLRTENDFRLSIAIQVFKFRRFIADARPNFMFLPMPFLVLRVFVPGERVPRKADINHVDPAIAVHVVSKVGKTIAVAFASNKFPHGANGVHLPIGSFVPNIASHHVLQTIVIHIAGCNTFGTKRSIKGSHLPGGSPLFSKGR